MSAHLQFGPEWMRKGAGKSTTPTSEVPLSLSSESSNSPGIATAQQIPSAPASGPGKSVWSSASQPGPRRNLSSLSSSAGGQAASPAPATSSSAVTSPGSFSFAAAASGAGQANPVSPGAQSAGVTPSGATTAEGEASRYTKRLLSLYSTERGPQSGPTSETQGIPANGGHMANASPQAPRQKKGFGFVSDRDGGRRTHSYNAEAGAAAAGGTEYRGGPRGYPNHPAGPAGEVRDSHRPGLFQRANQSGNGSSASNLPVGPGQGRERLGSGIHGGVLGSVLAPNAPSPKRNGKADEVNAARASSAGANGALIDDEVDEFGQPAKYTRTSHGPDGQVLTRDDWVRLRRERHPQEGPVGPPSDHKGGFCRGFEQRRERTSSARKVQGVEETTSSKVTGVAAALDKTIPAPVSSESTTDELLQHHAAKLVDALHIDDEDVPIQASMPDFPAWDPETCMWFYRDNAGQVQGPFNATTMQDWYAAHYFNDDLLVRRADVEHYTPLGKVLPLIGDSHTPFLIPPSQWHIVRAQHASNLNTGFPQQQPMQLQSGMQGFPSPAEKRDPGPANPAPMAWTTPTSSRFGFAANPMDVFGHQSPSMSNHVAGGGGAMHNYPFMSGPSFVDNGQLKGQDEYLAMIRENELAEHRRMLEQRQAQQASLFMAQGGAQADSPAMWDRMQGIGSPAEWNRHSEEHRQQVLESQQERFSSGLGHQGTELTDASTFGQVSREDGMLGQKYQSQADLDVRTEPAQKFTFAEAAPVSESVLTSVPDAGTDNVEIEPSGLAQGSPIDAGDRQEMTVTAAEAESMIPVKTKKSRKGKKLNLAPEVEDEAPQSTVEGDRYEHVDVNNYPAEVSLSSIMANNAVAGAGVKVAPWAATTASQETGNGTSLRAIQEAEERRAKANRQLRQQATPSSAGAVASSSPAPVSMSWGLAMPSSREQASAQQTSAASATGGGAGGPVWSAGAAAAPPKKTLTEIQQEEERRQRALLAAAGNASSLNGVALSAQSMSTAGAPLRTRGYADSASRAQGMATVPSGASAAAVPPQPSGTGWSVVGASGKPNVPAQPSVVHQPTPAIRSVSIPQPVETSANSVNTGKPPSPEFLQYCREQLRGLSSMRADDFIEMLLSFPIDATSDVVEIIAESVYAASSTLDGRRFAADFVAKRKVDAQGAGVFKRMYPGAYLSVAGAGSQAVGSNGLSSTPTAATRSNVGRSASDVLQSQPKPASNEALGGFKVVKAKGGKKRG